MKMLEFWSQFLHSTEDIYPHIIGQHFQMCLVDQDYTITYFKDFDSQIPVPFRVGQILPENSTSALCIKENKIMHRIVPKEIYGVEMRTISIPFSDRSGCVSVIFNVKTHHQVSTSIEQIVASTEQISATSQNIYVQTIEMNHKFDHVMAQVTSTVSTSSHLSDIYTIVKGVADQLKLISINALIQAAHAGEYGRGFSVVAQEVRKLADEANEQMKHVEDIVKRMSINLKSMEKEIQVLREYAEHQCHASKEISQAIEAVALSTQSLREITNKLLNLS
jgi:hypothetical protein